MNIERIVHSLERPSLLRDFLIWLVIIVIGAALTMLSIGTVRHDQLMQLVLAGYWTMALLLTGHLMNNYSVQIKRILKNQVFQSIVKLIVVCVIGVGSAYKVDQWLRPKPKVEVKAKKDKFADYYKNGRPRKLIPGVDYPKEELTQDFYYVKSTLTEVCLNQSVPASKIKQCWRDLAAICLWEGAGCHQDAMLIEPELGYRWASYSYFQITALRHQQWDVPLAISIECTHTFICAADAILKNLIKKKYLQDRWKGLWAHNGAKSFSKRVDYRMRIEGALLKVRSSEENPNIWMAAVLGKKEFIARKHASPPSQPKLDLADQLILYLKTLFSIDSAEARSLQG